jgi:hypothetical protein
MQYIVNKGTRPKFNNIFFIGLYNLSAYLRQKNDPLKVIITNKSDGGYFVMLKKDITVRKKSFIFKINGVVST